MWMLPDMYHPRKHCSRPEAADDSGLPRENNVPMHTAKTAQEWLEEHDKDPNALTRPPCSQDLNTIEQDDLPRNTQGPKKDTPRDPVSMPQWVAALRGPTQYQAGGFNVVVGQRIHNPIPAKSRHKKSHLKPVFKLK